ncbi:phosphodiesterase [Halomonas cupida]|uniref:phosphodiesterase n=1 Tax=Halomonas cupida TaxID=44933 RepID=UPI003A8E501F
MSGFIQLTDTHIVAEGQLAYGRSETAGPLRQAIATLNDQLPAITEVECVIVTGDLTDHGSEQEYKRFRCIMDVLALPYLVLPGNHDHRERLRATFADCAWMPRHGPIQWRRDFSGFCVIGLDTLVEGEHYGMIDADGLAFLDNNLAELGKTPVIVATHHPWLHSGIQAMDDNNLRNGQQLMERLEAYPGPARMISGHVHRALTTQIGNVLCQVSPSTCHAVHLDQRADSANSLVMEPGAMTLYQFRKSQQTIVSNQMAISQFEGPWPFEQEDARVIATPA